LKDIITKLYDSCPGIDDCVTILICFKLKYLFLPQLSILLPAMNIAYNLIDHKLSVDSV